MKSKVRVLFSTCVFLLSLSSLLWGDGNTVVGGAAGAQQTEIVFTVPGVQQVNIYQLPSETGSVSFGPGGTATSICIAPGTAYMPTDLFYMFASDSSFYGKRFQIKATGGTQTWKVTNPEPWKFSVGVSLGIVGVAVMAFGIAGAPGIELRYNTAAEGITEGVVGLGVLVCGILLALDAGAKAELIKIEQ